MPWVTEEEIQAAKNMTAYEYLRTHQAQWKFICRLCHKEGREWEDLEM